MNFKKYLLILSVFSLSQGIIVHAQKSELATSSQQSNIHKESDAFWSENLCRKYTPKGNLDVVRPFAAALKACPPRPDYAETLKAYKEFEKYLDSSCTPEIFFPSGFASLFGGKKGAATCLTSAGVRIRYVSIKGENGAQDLKTGKVWFFDYDTYKDNHTGFTQAEAISFCQSKGQSLPTKQDLELALKHRVFEVFYMKGQAWTSTVYPQLERLGYAYSYNYESGGKSMYYTDRHREIGVRCVSADVKP